VEEESGEVVKRGYVDSTAEGIREALSSYSGSLRVVLGA